MVWRVLGAQLLLSSSGAAVSSSSLRHVPTSLRSTAPRSVSPSTARPTAASLPTYCKVKHYVSDRERASADARDALAARAGAPDGRFVDKADAL